LAVVDDEIACARGRARSSHRTKSTVRPRPDHVGEVVANALEISVVRGRPARPPPAGFVRHTSERAQRVNHGKGASRRSGERVTVEGVWGRSPPIRIGAGYGDRTRLTGLGSQDITTMLSPRP